MKHPTSGPQPPDLRPEPVRGSFGTEILHRNTDEILLIINLKYFFFYKMKCSTSGRICEGFTEAMKPSKMPSWQLDSLFSIHFDFNAGP